MWRNFYWYPKVQINPQVGGQRAGGRPRDSYRQRTEPRDGDRKVRSWKAYRRAQYRQT